ncbi:MAG: hypothetical protein AAFO68_04960 [Pseudomonadota bacterium]
MLDGLQWLLSTSAIAQVLLVFLALEWVVLTLWRRRTGQGVPAGQLLSFLGAGGGFAVALWAALAEWPWIMMAAALSVAFAFHAFDLALRWKR